MTPEERRQRLAELRARKAELQSYTSQPSTPDAGVRRGGVVVEAPAGLSRRERGEFYRNAAQTAKETSAEEAFGLAGINSASLGNAEGILAAQERSGGILAPMTGGKFNPKSLTDFANPIGPAGMILAPYMRDRVKASTDQDFNQENEARQEELRQRRVLSREEHPGAALAGDAAGYITPGGAMLKGGSAVTRAAGNKFVSPAVRQMLTPAGKGTASKVARYTTGVGVPSAAASAADFGLYNATVAGSDLEDASLGDRAQLFKEGATNPLAWAAGPATSLLYRGGRGVATAVKSTKDASKDAGRLVIKKGSFTPQARADEVEAYLSSLPGSETPRQKALRMVYKRLKQQGMSTDDVRNAIKNASYGGYSSVDEMLFELAGASNDQLAVALGSVGGDAKKIARDRLTDRSAGAPARIRKDLRAAMGLEGDDFYALKGELKEKRLNEPKPLYDDAYGKQVSEETWRNDILPVLTESPSARKAIGEAIDYAKDTGNPAAARELEDFVEIAFKSAADDEAAQIASEAGELGLARWVAEYGGKASGDASGAPVLSTQALDYVDRMLGDMAEGIRRGSGRKELARGPATAQRQIRGSGGQGLDPETGLNVPRARVAELKSAEEALPFGRDAFKNGTDLETLVNEFDEVARRYGADGAKSEDIQSALLMGWLRGAEDAVEKATNPGTVIRQIYGSERQRNKLMQMLPTGEGLSSGSKSDLTKRIRALVGDQKSGRKGRIEREREFFDNQSRIIRNSPSAERLEAISEQGGAQDKIQQLISAVFAPKEAAKKLTQAAANRVTRPGIYNPEVNRELGDIMFSSGAKGLKGVADEIDSLPRIGGAGRVAQRGTGNNLALQSAPVRSGGMAGLRSDATNTAIGGAVGGMHPDLDGDGEVTAEERLKGIAIGAGGMAAIRGGAAYKRGLDNSVSRSVRSQAPAPARGHRGPININAYERAYEQAVAQTGIRKANDPKNHAVAIDLLTNAGFSREYADDIAAESMRALDRAALKQGGGLRVVGNDEPPTSGMGFSGAGGGGKPPKIKPGAPLGKLPKKSAAGDMVAGGVLGGALGYAPEAGADEGNALALNRASERVHELEASAIPGLEADLNSLEDPNVPAVEIQRLLERRGYDLGPTGADGVIGPETRKAIAQNRDAIKEELAIARSELTTARERMSQLEAQAAFDATRASPGQEAMRELSPWLGAAAGIGIGALSRGRGVKHSAATARKHADEANKLLSSGPISKSTTGPRGLNTRAANINEFWRKGGAGESVPFKTNQQGNWGPRPKPAEPSNLYPPGPERFRATDVGVMGAGLSEAGLATIGVNSAEKEIAAAQAAVDQDPSEANLARLERARDVYALAQTAQRLGLAVAAGRAAGAFKKPYQSARPDIASAEAERAILLSTMKKRK